MQIRLNEQGYVSDFAFIGTVEGGVEVEEPEDRDHFTEHFQSYKVRDGTLILDENQHKENQRRALCDMLRQRRETECFSFINRGQLWYDRLSEEQKSELNAWYSSWLMVTDTLTAPEKPSWLY